MGAICVHELDVGYAGTRILRDISLKIKEGKITTIIGVNGCGKSTLLKSIGGILPYAKGSIKIKGKYLEDYAKKELANVMSYLSQRHQAPPDTTVEELVMFGRFSHRKWFQQVSSKDRKVVDEMISITGLEKFRHRRVSTLSGGENQKAWIAMSLAQEPSILLLDEPTTFLDVYHQIEVLELLRNLNEEKKLTILMVLHDINHAHLYSDELVAIKDKGLHCCGHCHQVMDTKLLKEVFQIDTKKIVDNDCGCIFQPYLRRSS